MYEANFFFEPRAGVFLWSYDRETEEAWGMNPLNPVDLPISEGLRVELTRLGGWWDDSTGPDPSGPSLWRQDECDRFNAAARAALDRLRAELGPDWDIIRSFGEEREDPDLDGYLRDPRGFRRDTEAPTPLTP